MLYALIDGAGTIRRYEDFPAAAPDLAAEKGLRWLPVEDQRPNDQPEGGALMVTSETVEGGGVTRVWAVAPATSPQVVSMAQARIALRARGLLDVVAAAAAAAGGDFEIAWEYATEVHRNSSSVAALAAAARLSDADVDDLFCEAAAVVL